MVRRGLQGPDCEQRSGRWACSGKKKSDEQEKIGVKGMPVNPKILGGPSTTALSPDDPMLQPVDGISLADYAAVAERCQARKITDEAGMNQVAARWATTRRCSVRPRRSGSPAWASRWWSARSSAGQLGY